MKKVKLHLQLSEFQWLASWIKHIVEDMPVGWYPLECYVLAECYERNIRKFTFVREGSLSLRISEAISLKRLLMEYVLQKTYDDMMRNFIISQLDKQCPIK